MPRRTLSLGDSSIEVISDDGDTSELVELLFQGVPTDATHPPHAHIRLTRSDGEKPYHLERDGKQVYAGDSLAGLANSLMDTCIYNLADKCASGLLFHAACLSWKGRGVILPAQSGHGKTTLSAWLLANGFDYLTDELVYLPLGSRQAACFGRPLNVKYGSREIIDGLLGANRDHPSIVEGPVAMLVPPHLIRADNHPVEPDVSLIVFPRYRADAEFSAERLSAAQTGMAMMACLVNARNLPGDGFPATVELARQVPAYRLTYPGFDQLLETIRHWLEGAA